MKHDERKYTSTVGTLIGHSWKSKHLLGRYKINYDIGESDGFLEITPCYIGNNDKDRETRFIFGE